MAKHSKGIAYLALALQSTLAMAQVPGEEYEATPEHLDANFSEADAERLAAGFSNVIPGGGATNSLASMTGAADLVVRGLVLDQAYDYDARGVPSTRTTFLVSERLKGNHSKSQVTLVQPGGPARDSADKIMMSSHAHYFNVGEDEVLFLETDAESTSPFRRVSVMARYRVFEERLYSDDGRGVIVVPLQSGDDYRVAQGKPRHPNARFRKIYIGNQSFDKQFDEVYQNSRRPGKLARGKTVVDNVIQEGMDVNVFLDLVKQSGKRRQ